MGDRHSDIEEEKVAFLPSSSDGETESPNSSNKPTSFPISKKTSSYKNQIIATLIGIIIYTV